MPVDRGSAPPRGPRRRVVVTGASGGVGRSLVDALLEAGHDVVAVGREASRLPRAATPWVADLASGAGVSPALFAGVDVVYHCAGEIAEPALMQALHVGGTGRLLEVLRAADTAPPRWVQLSSVGAYGPPPRAGEPRMVDESSPERPVGEYEVTKTRADDLVRRADAEGVLAMALVRPTAIIGGRLPSRSLRQLVALVARRWYVHVGPPEAVANYVHVDDVVSALLTCGMASEAAGDVFNVASDCLWTDLIAEAAALAGVPPPRLRLPAGPVRAVARLAQSAGVPISPARVDALCGQTRYAMGKITNRLGFVVRRPLPGAVADVMGAHAPAGR